MKSTTLVIAAAAIAMFAQSAQAREHHYRTSSPAHEPQLCEAALGMDAGRRIRVAAATFCDSLAGSDQQRREFESYPQHTAYSGHSDGRPSAWCGWEMRRLVGSDPGETYNLARNWAHWGRSGPAGVGAVVVWPHHVGKIVGQENGEWVIESGNDGHALRTRPRSIAGAIAIRWG